MTGALRACCSLLRFRVFSCGPCHLHISALPPFPGRCPHDLFHTFLGSAAPPPTDEQRSKRVCWCRPFPLSCNRLHCETLSSAAQRRPSPAKRGVGHRCKRVGRDGEHIDLFPLFFSCLRLRLCLSAQSLRGHPESMSRCQRWVTLQVRYKGPPQSPE